MVFWGAVPPVAERPYKIFFWKPISFFQSQKRLLILSEQPLYFINLNQPSWDLADHFRAFAPGPSRRIYQDIQPPSTGRITP
jgi:hypothetical protein